MTVVCYDVTPSFCRWVPQTDLLSNSYALKWWQHALSKWWYMCQTRCHIPASHNLNTVMSTVWHANVENNFLPPPPLCDYLCCWSSQVNISFVWGMKPVMLQVSILYPATSIVSRCLYIQCNCPGLTVMPGVQTGCWAMWVSWQWRQSLALNHWHNGTLEPPD